MNKENAITVSDILENRRVMMKAALVAIILHLLFGIAAIARGEMPPDRLINALIKKEQDPKKRDMSIGDKHLKNKAYGCLQIRQTVCDDVNRRYGTHYKAIDCLGNHELSVRICKMYINMWATTDKLGRKPILEDMARIWNGGPSGYKKESTEGYWSVVKTFL